MIVTVGKDFNIALDSNATTGYQWQLARPLNTKIVRYVNPTASLAVVVTGTFFRLLA